MNELTPQERQLIMTLRHLRSITVIVHRNGEWRVVLADHEAGRTETGEGVDFASAWDSLSSNLQTVKD